MNQFLFETHAHTSEVSECSHVDAKTLVRAHAEAGYCGVAITDHFSDASFRGMDTKSWDSIVSHYLEGYETAKEAAATGFTVLLGMEVRFYENWNDYLVYGITESFLRENKNFLEYGIRKFSKIAQENGCIIFQAHPFRNGMTVTDPKLLNGIEVYNGNIRHDSRNDIAIEWAEKFQLKMSSGSDYHEIEDIARGGIITPKPIQNNREFIHTLMTGAVLKRFQG